MRVLSEHACFDGIQRFLAHDSRECRTEMRFSVYEPPQARERRVPVLYYLAGLTCTEETFMIKAGAQRLAAELGLMLVAPDTSPRQPRLPGDDASWDFGLGAGFYVDATQAPWDAHYRMYSYVTSELPALVIVDAVARLVPGVVGDEASVSGDTFARDGLLDFPQYTRPAEFRGLGVPPVLLSGHHAEIEKWRRQQAVERTRRHRPDLLDTKE